MAERGTPKGGGGVKIPPAARFLKNLTLDENKICGIIYNEQQN